MESICVGQLLLGMGPPWSAVDIPVTLCWRKPDLPFASSYPWQIAPRDLGTSAGSNPCRLVGMFKVAWIWESESSGPFWMENPTLVTISNIWAYGIPKRKTWLVAAWTFTVFFAICGFLEGCVTFPCHLAWVRTEKLLLELHCADSLFFVVRHDPIKKKERKKEWLPITSSPH